MGDSGARSKQQGIQGGYRQRHDVIFRVDPLDAAVVDFQSATLQIEKRVFVLYLRQFSGDLNEQAWPGSHPILLSAR
ncbi:hypothetical protein D3C84_835030 [compost metagenome]